MKRKKQQKNLMLTRSYARLGWIVLGVGLLACSCAKEQDEIISTGDDDASLIVPEALVGDVVETETKADLSGVVIGTSFPANYTKVFSVVGYKGTTAPTTDWSSPYIANIAVNSGSNGTLSFATPQYYPVDGQKVFFYAYSPVSGATYTAGTSSAAPKVTWTLNGHTDVMAAQVTTGIAKATTGTQSQPAFAFTHKLMQLKFKVMKDAALTDIGNVTALTVNNAAKTISMNLSNGNITTSSTGSITAYSSTTGQAVTTTAAYLGTNGSPCLTTKTDNLTLTLTCGSKTYTVTPDLPTDAGPGKICEITLKIIPDGLVITSITLNSSSSVTIPQAGGTFTLVAQTQSSPTSNISWLVKDANDNEVGSSSSYSNYSTATIQVNANTEWTARNLKLYWSYNGSVPTEYTGSYTLNQLGYSFTARFEASPGYWGYEGDRNLIIEGSFPTGYTGYLKADGGDPIAFTLTEKTTVHLPRNTSGSNITYQIYAVNAAHTYTYYSPSTIVQRASFDIGTDVVYCYGSINAVVKEKLGYEDCYNRCHNAGMLMLDWDRREVLRALYNANNHTKPWTGNPRMNNYDGDPYYFIYWDRDAGNVASKDKYTKQYNTNIASNNATYTNCICTHDLNI